MNKARYVMSMVSAMVMAVFMAGPAAAGVYRIDFYEADLSGGLVGADLDGDGIVDGTGTFNAPAGLGFVAVDNFNVTLAGITWDTLAPASTFPGPVRFVNDPAIWPVPLLQGFVFEDPADIGAPEASPSTVLQMESTGFASPGGPVTYVGLWALSPCRATSCGGGGVGGLARGTFVITPGTSPVPVPATLPLAMLALAALAAVPRQRTADKATVN